MFLLSRLWIILFGFFLVATAEAGFEEDYETKQWQEVEVQLPGGPNKGALQSFYVSATTDNIFAIDTSSLSVGSDGVVRYVLQIASSEGALTTSFEGMRCETREWRIYASGRRDGSWSKSRVNAWSPIRDVPNNRQHAALFSEYFCPDGIAVRTAADAVNALRRGGHPDVKRH